ncbi:MAG: hypothetical protein ACTHM9_14095 [Gemmatimonadales bacterium]
MRPTLGFVLLLGALAACDAAPTDPAVLDVSGSTPSLKAVTTTASVKIPIVLDQLIPCANGGAGEIVHFSGILHDLFHVTVHADGQFTIKVHDQPQGVAGVGEETGNVYHATGVTQETTRNGRVGFTDTFINNFKLIGTGNAGSLRIHQTIHVTVNGNGTVTVRVDHLTASCR